MKRHPPPVGFDFDSEPPKSPDTSDLSSSRIEVSSWVLVRDSPNNRSPSQLGHSLNPSGLAVLVKSRSKKKMGMSHDRSSPKLNVWVRCWIMSFFKNRLLVQQPDSNYNGYMMAADAADVLPLDITNANRSFLEHNMSNEVPPPAIAPFILAKKTIWKTKSLLVLQYVNSSFRMGFAHLV